MTDIVILESDIMNRKRINDIVRESAKASDLRSWFQVANTLIPYLALLTIMYFMIYYQVNYFFVLLVSVLPALFLVRIFILFHDCTHSSFMKSKRAMNIIGNIFGIIVFTPFNRWKREHITHHRSVGNIDKRGTGDVWTMTVDEYKNSSFMKKLGYRLYRNPLVLFVIGPIYMFVLQERFPRKSRSKSEVISLWLTNLGILSIIAIVALTIGIKYYFMIQIPIIFMASSLGVWMFFVQHQYEDVYWEDNENWDVTDAALKGSSVYKLPIVLDWFTGNIGYHNIHHLNARIPNYRLRKLFKNTKEFQVSRQIKLFESIGLARLFLYDKENKKLITYRKYKRKYS